METTSPAVFEIGLLLLLAGLAGWAARRLGLPAVVGYLAVGLVVSPFTPGYVADRHQIEVLADVGVVLLLFEVGIEIDPVRALQLTIGLSQLGEFGFVLASIGVALGVVPPQLYTAVLAVVAVSIALSAILVRAFPRATEVAA